MVSSNHPNILVRLVLSSLFAGEGREKKRQRNFPKVTQLVRGRAGTGTPVVWLRACEAGSLLGVGAPQWPGSQQVTAPGPAVAVASLCLRCWHLADPGHSPAGEDSPLPPCQGTLAALEPRDVTGSRGNGPPCVRGRPGQPLPSWRGRVSAQQGLPHTHRSLLSHPVPVLLGPQLEERRG